MRSSRSSSARAAWSNRITSSTVIVLHERSTSPAIARGECLSRPELGGICRADKQLPDHCLLSSMRVIARTGKIVSPESHAMTTCVSSE